MHKHAALALANPVFDPDTQITSRFFWQVDRTTSAGLTVNIGSE